MSRRWLVGLLLSALIGSQWLALLHEVGHGGGRPAGTDIGSATPAAASGTTWSQDAVHAATDHVEGTALCQLLQQLAQPAPPQTLPCPQFEPPAWPARYARRSLGRLATPAAAAYSARAPPGLA